MNQPSDETEDAWQTARERMVGLIESRGVTAPRVITAMLRIPRERFVPEAERDLAYADRPVMIGHEQTISQPFIVAYMIEALNLKGGEKVLEVGAGSGYAAAILAEMGMKVFAVERLEELVEQARANLKAADYDTVNLICGDGSKGWPAEAPFDAILVSAGAAKMPAALVDQLAVGGRMIIPIGDWPGSQALIRVTRVSRDEVQEEHLCDVYFVPLIESEASGA